MFKTNVMRILEIQGMKYTGHPYEANKERDGVSVAGKIGKPVEQVFKTLVTQGEGSNYYIFVVPVAKELDLKAAARAVGAKSVEMIKIADITKVTGYIRGGCSPIGMKKQYKTIIDSSCEDWETIIVSAGKIGYQIELSPSDLIKLTDAQKQQISI